jgi:hypothetical protein
MHSLDHVCSISSIDNEHLFGAFFYLISKNNFRATFVGFAYGIATVASSSLLIPMAFHSLNNLIGGLFWYLNSNSISKEKLN